MEKVISVIGGDQRIGELAKIFSENNKVFVYGLEKLKSFFTGENIYFKKSIKETVKDSKTIICPLPFSRDNKTIIGPYSDERIYIKEIFENAKNKTIIAGGICSYLVEKAQIYNIKIIDLLKQEDLTIFNTIATAEGAIGVAIKETNIHIHNSKVLILGYGRVGKTVANRFEALNADVTCAARKSDVLAWIETDGYKAINIQNMNDKLNEFDIIINTVPSMILDKVKLKYVRKDCVIIDLASKPGGVDFEETKKLGINARLELALPGRVAPKSSAIYIYI